MSKQLGRIVLFVSIALGVFATIVVVNQTIQFVQFTSTIHPALGSIVLIILLIVFGVLILIPIVSMLRLPRALRPPEGDDAGEVEAYLAQLRKRLAKNPLLVGTDVDLSTRPGIEAALKRLDAESDAIIKSTAKTMFVSTAISQNGQLDAIMVLVAQGRMVWRVSHVYNQRPHWRELLHLYTNVMTTALFVSEIEDLDISEQIEPIVASIMGSGAASMVPGVSLAANILASSLLEGTANAFLTLRVGMVAKRYSTTLTQIDRRLVRRSATIAAAALLGTTVADSAKVVSRAVAGAVADAGKGSVRATRNTIASTFQKFSGLFHDGNTEETV